MTIRLICLDLDGTTLRRDGNVSDRTIATLRRAMAEGVTVAIATGRIHISSANIGRRIGINGPVISSNGALIKDLSGKVWLYRPMPASAVAATLEVCRTTRVRMDLFVSDGLYTAYVADRRRAYLSWWWRQVRSLSGLLRFCRWALTFKIMPLEACRGPVDKLFISDKDPDRFQEACARFTNLVPEPLTVCSSAPDNLELTAGGVSKGSAVVWLAERLGIPLNEVMVAGDSNNDLSMFELDCFKVAMGNADDEIKERASVVTASHDDDGVAVAVERFVLGEAAV